MSASALCKHTLRYDRHARAEYGRGGAVVLFEEDLLRPREVAHHVPHILDLCRAPAIDYDEG